MKQIKIETDIQVANNTELNDEEKTLIEKAIENLSHSYAPYSRFNVSAIIQTSDKHTFSGTNQENASYPCGLCAERVALFSARNSTKQPIECIFLVAKNENGILPQPVTPCGACRQVLCEYEQEQGSDIRIYMVGKETTMIAPSAKSLLPLSFNLPEI